ncbi:MAG: hypothetical protein U1D30_03640 [Planctomycetota bacterium]
MPAPFVTERYFQGEGSSAMLQGTNRRLTEGTVTVPLALSSKRAIPILLTMLLVHANVCSIQGAPPANTNGGMNPVRPLARQIPGQGPMQMPAHPRFAPKPKLPTQPVYVRVSAPEGAKITFYGTGGKPHRFDAPVTVGLRPLLRYVFALENLPDLEGKQFFGTIEVVGMLAVPPQVKPSSVPIPVVFVGEDLISLVRETMITKVIALENPENALPYLGDPNDSVRYTAGGEENPIEKAKGLGTLMLVVRMGNRIPTPEEISANGMQLSLLLPRRIRVQDASGAEHEVVDRFYDSDTGADVAIQLATHRSPAPAGPAPAMAADPTSACPAPGCAPNGMPGGMMGAAVAQPYLWQNPYNPHFKPERQFLCDGGDLKPRAGFGLDGYLVNVNPSDTVAVYEDITGKRKIKESNRVCIFAPRFLEVRQERGVEAFQQRRIADRIERDDILGTYTQLARETERFKYERAKAAQTRQRASEVVGEQWKGDFMEVRSLDAFDQGLGWAAEIGVQQIGKLHNSEQAMIAKRVVFAKTMTQVQFPQVIAMVEGTGQLVSVWRHQEIRKIEENPGFDCLKIEKIASATHANIGDTVEFMIRVTNTGTQPANNVAIVDSLTARLEYVADSARSERKATFLANFNEVGSNVLRWEFHEPLQPDESTIVSFRALVR